MDHKWFLDTDFKKIEARDVEPEFLPDITRANCETNTDDLTALFVAPPEEPPLAPEQIAPFKKYSEFVGDKKKMFQSGKFIPTKPSAIRRMSRRISNAVAPDPTSPDWGKSVRMRRASEVEREKPSSSSERPTPKSPKSGNS
jgi:hypothetical protein